MAAADNYMNFISQAADRLRQTTKRPEVVNWALQQRVGAAIASFTNATGPSAYASLLDMMVLATLKRHAVEEYWIPNLLHEEGDDVLKAYRGAEDHVWALAATVLSRAQLEEVRTLTELWRRDNPSLAYVSHIRFTEFVSSMRVSPSEATRPGSVFSLVYLDPLAGFDPVAKELRAYRELTERMMFIANRMPIVLSWQMDLVIHQAANDPQVLRVVDSAEKIAESTARFTEATDRFAGATTRTADAISRTADAVGKVSGDVTAERVAAIEQLNAALSEQRKAAFEEATAGVTLQRVALTKELEAQSSQIGRIVGDVRGVVDRADQAGVSINAATGDTIRSTEQSMRRTLNHAFGLALLLITAIPLSLLLYRLAAKRWVSDRREPASG